MQRRYFWIFVAVLVLFFSGLLIFIPNSHALIVQAHTITRLDTPTPTPDTSATYQMVQQDEGNIQTILSIINIIVVAFPLLLTIAAAVLGVIGVRGYQSFEKQAQEKLDSITSLEREAEQKKVSIERTQTAIVYFALGDRLSNQKETREAIEAYKKARSLLPDDPQINYVVGRIFSGAGYYDAAIEAFESAIDRQKDFPEAEMELGLAYRRRGDYQQDANAQELLKSDYEKALGYYERAYRVEPGSSYSLGNAASLAWYLGKIDLARNYYRQTGAAAEIRLTDTHSEIFWDYYDLALSQLILGKTDEAKNNYQKAIRETPGVVQFDSVLNVLHFLRTSKDQINGLDDVISMIETEKATKIALG